MQNGDGFGGRKWIAGAVNERNIMICIPVRRKTERMIHVPDSIVQVNEMRLKITNILRMIDQITIPELRINRLSRREGGTDTYILASTLMARVRR